MAPKRAAAGKASGTSKKAKVADAKKKTTKKKKKVRVLGVIPARYGSTRFPAKPLALIGGKPMIWHTYTNACKAQNLDYCCVATDDPRIEKVVKAFGGEVVMTDPKCENGTERCLEVYQKLKRKGKDFDVIVNIQGDEPFIEAHHIETVADVVASSDAVMGTLARPATGEADVMSVNNVKCVLDVNGYALYFSRALIPHNKKGVYDPSVNYRADFLPKFIKMPESNLQKSEDLEQNKVIEAGYRIKVGIVTEAVHGVDTPEQLDDLNRMLASGEIQMTNA